SIAPDLPEVIHNRDRLETSMVGRARDLCEGRAQLRRTARPGEIRNVQSELHEDSSERGWSVPIMPANLMKPGACLRNEASATSFPAYPPKGIDAGSSLRLGLCPLITVVR